MKGIFYYLCTKFMMMRILILLLLLFPFFVSAQKNSGKKEKKKELQAYFDYKIFQIPNDTLSYIEGYLQFDASKIKYHPVNERDLQGQIAVEYQLKRGDSVYTSKLYKFLTPIMKDSIVDNFLEVFRIKVAAGIYELKIGLLDVYTNNDFVYSTQAIEVPKVSPQPYISDVIIAEHLLPSAEESVFNKNGILVYPRIRNFFDDKDIKLPYYLEAYHIDNKATYLLKWSIVDDSDGKPLLEYSGARKLDTVNNQVLYGAINIADLPSGEYNLVMQLTANNKDVLSTKKYFFAKQNVDIDNFKVSDEPIIVDPAFQASIKSDSLKFYLASLYPVSGKHEDDHIKLLIKKGNEDQMRNYMEKFWIAMAKQSGKGKKPYDVWLSYKAQVDLVDRKFKALNMPGYKTDRGRVYLQYGAPSSIVVQETSPSEYPYEMWFYDKIDHYSNRKFIFYSPSLLPNNYELLHSDMVGELHNYRWEHDLNRRNSPIHDIDDPNDGNVDHYGGNSSIYYNQH